MEALEDLKKQGREPSPWGVALIYIGLDEHDRAFEWLDKAVEARSWELPILRVLPPSSVGEKFRADPRYTRLLARIRLPA